MNMSRTNQGADHSGSRVRDLTRGAARAMRRGRWLRNALAAMLALVLATLAAQWFANRAAHVYVVDSRIGAGVVTVSSEVTGTIRQVAVSVGDRVIRGDLMVRVDARKAELALAETNADIARLRAERQRLVTEQRLVERRSRSKLQAAQADVGAARAARRAAAAELELASHQLERARSLYQRGLVSSQEFEAVEAHYRTAREHERQAKAEVESAEANLAVLETELDEIQVIARDIEALEAELDQLAARRASQQEDLQDSEIRAEFDGVVDAVFVDAGEHAEPGSRLFMYHDPARVWVDANVKETQFRRLALGAPATVRVDAYPDRVFRGEVSRLGNSATSQFALLPSPNPSGNFTKVTQRLPVRIAIPQAEGLLRPGMMVEVEIDAVR